MSTVHSRVALAPVLLVLLHFTVALEGGALALAQMFGCPFALLVLTHELDGGRDTGGGDHDAGAGTGNECRVEGGATVGRMLRI